MKDPTVYTLTVAIEEDYTAEPGAEDRELAAQLRLAAQHVSQQGAPLPGSSPVKLSGSSASAATAYLSAVEL